MTQSFNTRKEVFSPVNSAENVRRLIAGIKGRDTQENDNSREITRRAEIQKKIEFALYAIKDSELKEKLRKDFFEQILFTEEQLALFLQDVNHFEASSAQSLAQRLSTDGFLYGVAVRIYTDGVESLIPIDPPEDIPARHHASYLHARRRILIDETFAALGLYSIDDCGDNPHLTNSDPPNDIQVMLETMDERLLSEPNSYLTSLETLLDVCLSAPPPITQHEVNLLYSTIEAEGLSGLSIFVPHVLHLYKADTPREEILDNLWNIKDALTNGHFALLAEKALATKKETQFEAPIDFTEHMESGLSRDEVTLSPKKMVAKAMVEDQGLLAITEVIDTFSRFQYKYNTATRDFDTFYDKSSAPCRMRNYLKIDSEHPDGGRLRTLTQLSKLFIRLIDDATDILEDGEENEGSLHRPNCFLANWKVRTLVLEFGGILDLLSIEDPEDPLFEAMIISERMITLLHNKGELFDPHAKPENYITMVESLFTEINKLVLILYPDIQKYEVLNQDPEFKKFISRMLMTLRGGILSGEVQFLQLKKKLLQHS